MFFEKLQSMFPDGVTLTMTTKNDLVTVAVLPVEDDTAPLILTGAIKTLDEKFFDHCKAKVPSEPIPGVVQTNAEELKKDAEEVKTATVKKSTGARKKAEPKSEPPKPTAPPPPDLFSQKPAEQPALVVEPVATAEAIAESPVIPDDADEF